jgi:hypothetical protein
MTSPRYLLNHRDAKYSLDGEAGVLGYVLSQLPEPDSWVIEFGACDGLQFSNCADLIVKGHHAVLIEPDEAQFPHLTDNMKPFPKVICLKEFIGISGEQRLDVILAKTPCPTNPDLMIIDVDNNDYHIFKAIEKYLPKILMIEINSTLLPDQEKIAIYDAPFVFGHHGSSILSMTQLAEKKGYRLVCNLSCNAIFVQTKYYDLFFKRTFTPADFYTFEGIYGQRFWRDMTFTQKWRKFTEAVRREWVLHGRGHQVWDIVRHFTGYLLLTSRRFIRR